MLIGLLVLVLVCSGLMLGGCGHVEWIHASKSAQEFDADMATCQAQAGQAVGMQRDPFGERRSQVYGACMRGKGWTLTTRK